MNRQPRQPNDGDGDDGGSYQHDDDDDDDDDDDGDDDDGGGDGNFGLCIRKHQHPMSYLSPQHMYTLASTRSTLPPRPMLCALCRVHGDALHSGPASHNCHDNARERALLAPAPRCRRGHRSRCTTPNRKSRRPGGAQGQGVANEPERKVCLPLCNLLLLSV